MNRPRPMKCAKPYEIDPLPASRKRRPWPPGPVDLTAAILALDDQRQNGQQRCGAYLADRGRTFNGISGIGPAMRARIARSAA